MSGLEENESAMLSVGDSNLMLGVFAIVAVGR